MIDRLRAEVAAELGLTDVPGWLWRQLGDAGLVRNAAEGSRSARERLFKKAHELLREHEERTSELRFLQSDSGTPERPTVQESRQYLHRSQSQGDAGRLVRAREESAAEQYTAERSTALSAYLGERARQVRFVRSYRNIVLEGQILTAEQAYALLRSPAGQFLSLNQFRELGIPVVGHRSRHVGHSGNAWAPYTEEEVVAKMQRSAVEKRPPRWEPPFPGSLYNPDEVTLRIEWDGGEVEHTFQKPEAPEGRKKREEWELQYLDQEQVFHFLETWHESVFDFLQGHAKRLAKSFQWTEHRAVWFILTDEVPWMCPVEVGYQFQDTMDYTRLQVNFAVEPWVPDEVLLSIYRHNQREILGGPNRRLGPQPLALFRFVLAQEQQEGRRPSWRTLLERWNAAHAEQPDWQYRRPEHMTTEYHRILSKLTRPHYSRNILELTERGLQHIRPKERDNQKPEQQQAGKTADGG
jgi:hypothetical protein